MLDLEFEFVAPKAPSVDEAALDQMHAAGVETERSIRQGWPVKTGRSRAAWRTTLTDEGFELDNETRYAAYVKGGDKLIDDVLTRVTRSTAEALADSLPESILAEVKHG